MKKVWELYAIAVTIIEKLCHKHCSHLSIVDVTEECKDYIRMRLESNTFQALKNYDPTRGAKEETYLHMVVSRRIIDFFNSSKKNRELFVIDSIREEHIPNRELDDYSEILDKITQNLSFEEQTYLKYLYIDELSYQEIGDILGLTRKQIYKKFENLHKKLKTRAIKLGYTLEDIL